MWASDLGFEILGRRIRLQSQEQTVASEMARLWEHWRRDSSAARLRDTFSVADDEGLRLFRDCARLISTQSVAQVVLRLLMEANRHVLTQFGGFAAHAAVVAGSQRVTAVLGESGVGKTTLAAAAVLAGLAYGSDEALCVDRESGKVLAYPRPLGLSPQSQRLLKVAPADIYVDADEAPILPGELGGEAMNGGGRLTDIVIPERTPDTSPHFEALSPADGAAALLSNSFNHYRDPQGSYLLTAKLAAEARIWRFTYSEALASGQALAEHLHSEP